MRLLAVLLLLASFEVHTRPSAALVYMAEPGDAVRFLGRASAPLKLDRPPATVRLLVVHFAWNPPPPESLSTVDELRTLYDRRAREPLEPVWVGRRSPA